MSIFGKQHEHTKNTEFTHKLGNASKTVLGLGVSMSLAYVSYKYGYSTLGHIFDYRNNNISSMGDELMVLGMSSFIGLFVGFMTEALIRIPTNGQNYKISNALKYSSVLPVLALAGTSYFEPNATEYLLNVGQIAAKTVGGSTLAVASSLGIISPIFSKQIGNKLIEKFDKLTSFSELTEKFSDYWQKRKAEKILKNNQKGLTNLSHQSSDNTNKEANDNTVIQKITEVHQTLSSMIPRYSITDTSFSNIQDSLKKIFSKSSYIIMNNNLETLSYKQEVLSLYGSILPQIINSYSSSLEHSSMNEKIANTEKLTKSLGKINEHFGRLENVIYEQKKIQKNMDFDDAVEFANARFHLPADDISQHNQKMNFKGNI
jgi:hypothetical protein